jgi:hypothetical protein
MVQSFLVGQPEFRDILQRPEMRQLKQRVIASYHLGPLDAEETRHYIEHRLRHVGWEQRPSFDPDTFPKIHALTEGVPRRINTLCDRLLLAAFLSSRDTISVPDVQGVGEEQSDELGGKSSVDNKPTLESPSADLRSTSVEPSAPRTERRVWTAGREAERIAHLEERLEMLEASNTMMFNLMRKILKTLRQSRHATKSAPPLSTP